MAGNSADKGQVRRDQAYVTQQHLQLKGAANGGYNHPPSSSLKRLSIVSAGLAEQRGLLAERNIGACSSIPQHCSAPGVGDASTTLLSNVVQGKHTSFWGNSQSGSGWKVRQSGV